MLSYFALLTPAICAIAAAVLAWGGKDGWGWFLFVAFLIYPAVKLIDGQAKAQPGATTSDSHT